MIIEIENQDKIHLRNSNDIYGIMRLILTEENKVDGSKEHFWTIALSVASKIVNIELVSFGSYRSTACYPTEVFSVPLQKKASHVVLIHNHPSGHLKPSQADIDITDRLYQVGKIMYTEVLDHLIISPHSYYSFQDNGLMDQFYLSSKYLPGFELEKRYQKHVDAIEKKVEKQKNAVAKQMKQEGIQKGIEIGEETGIKKGKLSIAKEMLREGLHVDMIIKVTGLPKITINKLYKDL